MEKKSCCMCRKTKSDTEFAWRNKEKGYRVSYCKPCRRQYNKGHYKSNKRLYLERNKRARLRLAAFVDSLKTGPCMDCGRAFAPCAMDFDHRDSATKIQQVSHFAKVFNSRRLILEEVAKCDLVCAVCHRLRTCRRGGHKHLHRPQSLDGEAPLS